MQQIIFQILFIMAGQFYQYFQYKQITKAGSWVCLIVSSLWSRNRHFLRVVWSDLSTFTLYWSCFLISPPCPTCSSWGSLWQSWPWVPHAGCCEGGKHWTVCLTVMSAICLNTLLVVTNDLSNIGCIPPIFPPSLPQTLRPPRTSRMRSPRPPAVMQRTRERSPPAGRGATSEASKWQNIFEDFKCCDLKTR